MVVALLTVEFHVPGSHSLKDKRMVVRRVKDRLKKFNVSVAEVDHHDLWQRSALAVVTVSTDQAHADRELAAVARRDRAGRTWLITADGNGIPDVMVPEFRVQAFRVPKFTNATRLPSQPRCGSAACRAR